MNSGYFIAANSFKTDLKNQEMFSCLQQSKIMSQLDRENPSKHAFS